METKHTQGQWASTHDASKERGVRTFSGFICFLPKPTHYHGQDERYDNEIKEYEANAKLIAASPDLLEALQMMIKEFSIISDARNEYEQEIAVSKAEKAIEKAIQ